MKLENVIFSLFFIFFLTICNPSDPIGTKEKQGKNNKECKETITYLLWVIIIQEQCDQASTNKCAPYQWMISNADFLCGGDMGM